MAQHVMHSLRSEKNLGDYRLNKGVSEEEPRYGQAQDGAGQAVKGAGF